MINTNNSIDRTLYALDLIAQRHKALSSNIANMDTPNYRRKDISFSQYLGGTANPLETRLAAIMGPSPVTIETSSEQVNAANELSEMQKNAVLYSVATRRMTTIINQMTTAARVGST